MNDMMRSQMFINGEWVPPAGKDYFESFNPYTGKPWMMVARGDAEDADRVVEAAWQAFHNPQWRDLTASARAPLLCASRPLVKTPERCTTILLDLRDQTELPIKISLHRFLNRIATFVRLVPDICRLFFPR